MRILKIESLPCSKNWIDRDELMLHSCFQILSDFITKENGDEHVSYENHKDFVDEVRFLNSWWHDRKDMIDLPTNQHLEDDVMLVRLMKIRTSLWT
jgi:hypothetical protein